MKINKKELTYKIGQMVAERIIKEFAENGAPAQTPMSAPVRGLDIFVQLRNLKVEVQHALLAFEKVILKELGLKDLNDMDPMAQKTYSEAMDIMHAEVIEAVKKAVLTVKTLPKEEEVPPATPSAGAPAPQVKLNVTK